MRIGQSEGKSAISTADADSVTVRGRDLCQELMGAWGFTKFFAFLLTGEEPSEKQTAMLDASLLAIAEHGLTPSVVSARQTHAADPEALQGAVAAGILGCGSTVLGTAEQAGAYLHEGVERWREAGGDPEPIALEQAKALRAGGARLPGFGHPLHKPVDPRCERLLELAEECGVAGEYCRYARAVQSAAAEAWGRPLVMNVSFGIPAVLLDAKFSVDAMKGIPILARTAGLLGHLLEEKQRPLGFHLAASAAESVAYDGEVNASNRL